MALPKIQAVITADTKQAEAGFDRVERGLNDVGKAADRAATRTDAMGVQLNRTAGRSSAFGRGLQNASFQMADFANQVGAGTSASVALGQQLPQLLGGFGILGAVLGAVVAVAVPLTRAFQGMSEQGADLSQVLGVLSPLAERLGNAFRAVAEIGVQMAEVIINNLDRILITAGLVAGFFAAKWVAAFVAARVATFTLAGALGVLRAALIRTGIGALVVGAGELVYQFTRLVQAAGGFGAAMGLLGDVAVEVWGRIKDGAAALGAALNSTWISVQAGFMDMVAYVQTKWSDLLYNLGAGVGKIPGLEGLGNKLMSAGNDALQSAVGAGGTAATADELRARAGEEGDRAAGLLEGLDAPLKSVQKIKDLLASIKDERITLPDLLGVAGGDEGEGGGKGGKSVSEKLDEELTAQEERIKTHFERVTALAKGGLSDKLGAWGNYFSGLIQLTGSNNKKLLAAQKTFVAAQALIDAFGAYNKVLNDPTPQPWYVRLAAAGQVFAAAMGAVNAIKSASESGGSASIPSASAGSSAAAAPAIPTQTVAINLQGDTFSRSSVEGLLEQIQSQLDRGGRLVFS